MTAPAPIRSDDLFFGNASFDPQPNWIDLSKVAIPQADEQQRLLVNLLGTLTADKKPIPRFWYLPRGVKAAVIMTGDDHANGATASRFDQFRAASPAGCSVAQWECIRGTSYVYSGLAADQRPGRDGHRRRVRGGLARHHGLRGLHPGLARGRLRASSCSAGRTATRAYRAGVRAYALHRVQRLGFDAEDRPRATACG